LIEDLNNFDLESNYTYTNMRVSILVCQLATQRMMVCIADNDICHFFTPLRMINIGSMFRQELQDLALFQGFTPQQVEHLLTLMEDQAYPAEVQIFAQGARAEYLYILYQGEVNIHYKPYDGPAMVIARILPGGVFGWSAALGRATYTSAAMTVQPSRVLRIRGEQLQHLCEYFPDTGAILLERLANLISERLDNLHGDVLNILGRGMDLKGECMRRIRRHERKSTPV